jgi:hypothetical protein
LIVSTTFIGAFLASIISAVPEPLPPIALGWTLLFHLERAVGLLALAGGGMLVAWRATEGRFPVRFGQIEYAVEDTAATTRILAIELEQRICCVEAALEIERDD